jgi:cytoplasmic iron level regulating protein YaaA (DUF328/UPF0246 family)
LNVAKKRPLKQGVVLSLASKEYDHLMTKNRVKQTCIITIVSFGK